MPAVLDAGRNALEESVFGGDGFVNVSYALDGKTELKVWVFTWLCRIFVAAGRIFREVLVSS